MKVFPTNIENYDTRISDDCSGMDLRDYFAAKAMQAMLTWEDVGNVSQEAYMMADAMMEARK